MHYNSEIFGTQAGFFLFAQNFFSRMRRDGTLNGHVAVSGPMRDLRLDADVIFDDAAAGLSHVVARGGLGMERSPTARDLAVQLRPLQLATVSGAGVHLPVGGVLEGTATVSGVMSTGFRARGGAGPSGRGTGASCRRAMEKSFAKR